MGLVGDAEDDEPIRVHCHAVMAQPGGKELAVCMGFNPPRREDSWMPKAPKDAAVVAVSTHRSELAGIAAQRGWQEAKDESFIESLPADQRVTVQRAAVLGAATRPIDHC